MMNYKLEELLPVVAKLTERYTGKQSTSISYEKAKQLIEAVLYCMNQCSDSNQMTRSKGRNAAEVYQLGYEKLVQKVKKTQIAYNNMIIHFNAYGNENYYDTVIKAIPGFFRYYDVWFAPQDTIITMDYPTLRPITKCSGIDAIEKYVEYISYEQRFMAVLPEEYICEVLHRFQNGYKKQFYNICSIILRHILGCAMIGKPFGDVTRKEDYEILGRMVREHNSQWMERKLFDLLEKLIVEKYEYNRLMEYYLQADLKNFAMECYFAAQNNSVQKVIVL